MASDMTECNRHTVGTVKHALQVLTEASIPSTEQIQTLRLRNQERGAEVCRLEKRVKELEQYIADIKKAACITPGESQDTLSLIHERVNNNQARRDLELSTDKHNKAALEHTRAAADLKHEACCLTELYNKSATKALFGLGDEEVDYMAIQQAVEKAIETLAEERINDERRSHDNNRCRQH